MILTPNLTTASKKSSNTKLMNDLAISCTTLADYVDRTFKQMGLVESASDLLRHLQWEIEEYKEAEDETERAKEAYDIAVLAARLFTAVLNEAVDSSAVNYAAFEKEDQIRRRMLYALKYFKERTKENLSGVTPYECYADAKKHLNQND